MAVKRKLTYGAVKSASKRARTPMRSMLSRVNYNGDIIPRNLHLFGAGVQKPSNITRSLLRYGVSGFSGGVGGGSGGGVQFILNNAVNYTDFTNLFDQYRIVAAEVAFMPYFNEVLLAAGLQGRLLTCIDYDDIATPASANTIRAFPSCRITEAWEKCTRTVVPHIAEAAYTGAFGGFSNKGPQWIDSASPGVTHYGIKMWAEPSAVTASQWYVEVKLFVEFRNARAA